jgi:hypothetical protein
MHMTRVILDAGSMIKLHNLMKPLELCDESGTIRARLIPILDTAEYEAVPPPELSDQELEKRRQSEKWYTTAEVLKHLETL